MFDDHDDDCRNCSETCVEYRDENSNDNSSVQETFNSQLDQINLLLEQEKSCHYNVLTSSEHGAMLFERISACSSDSCVSDDIHQTCDAYISNVIHWRTGMASYCYEIINYWYNNNNNHHNDGPCDHHEYYTKKGTQCRHLSYQYRVENLQHHQAVALAVSYVDRFFWSRLRTKSNDRIDLLRRDAMKSCKLYQLIVVTSLYMAMKITIYEPFDIDSIILMTRGKYSVDEVCATELLLLDALDYYINPVTPISFAYELVKLLVYSNSLCNENDTNYSRTIARYCSDGVVSIGNTSVSNKYNSNSNSNDSNMLYDLIMQQIQIAIVEYDFVGIHPSIISYSSIINALQILLVPPNEVKRIKLFLQKTLRFQGCPVDASPPLRKCGESACPVTATNHPCDNITIVRNSRIEVREKRTNNDAMYHEIDVILHEVDDSENDEHILEYDSDDDYDFDECSSMKDLIPSLVRTVSVEGNHDIDTFNHENKEFKHERLLVASDDIISPNSSVASRSTNKNDTLDNSIHILDVSICDMVEVSIEHITSPTTIIIQENSDNEFRTKHSHRRQVSDPNHFSSARMMNCCSDSETFHSAGNDCTAENVTSASTVCTGSVEIDSCQLDKVVFCDNAKQQDQCHLVDEVQRKLYNQVALVKGLRKRN